MAISFMMSRTSASVLAYVEELVSLSDIELEHQLPASPQEGEPWYGYVEDPRSLTLFLNLQLNRLTAEIKLKATTSRIGEICTQHHRAYRDLTGLLVGIDPVVFDAVPSPGDWPVRNVIWHITGAELGFSLLIDWAAKRAASDQELPIEMPSDEMAPHYDNYPESGAMEELNGRYADLHRQVVSRLLELTTDQLDAQNIWWEGYEVPVWFRMHRFDAHLREHTIQVDKTRQALGRAPSEAERLGRLLHQSLAEIEIAFELAQTGWDDRDAELAAAFESGRLRLGEL